jgi:hypothetical protein
MDAERHSANYAITLIDMGAGVDEALAYQHAITRDEADAFVNEHLGDLRQRENKRDFTETPREQPRPKVHRRALSAAELAESQMVFGDGLDYTRVRINEGSSLPGRMGRIGARLRGAPPPEHNAITLGNTCYF